MSFLSKIFSRKREVKESRTDAYIYQDGYIGAQYPKDDYRKMAKDAYMENAIAYRCIYLIASGCASVPWNVMKKSSDPEGDPEIEINNPASILLTRPNPSQSWSALTERIISFYMLAGDSYIERITLKTGTEKGTPKELYCQSPEEMKVVKDANGITGYQYGDGPRATTWDIDPITQQCDILHLKTFHPLDNYYGFAPTMAAAGHIDNSNDALAWNRATFKNGARPGTLVLMERSLTKEQYDRFREQMVNNYGGPKNAGKTMIMDNVGEGKVDIKPFGWNPKEMDWIETNREDARRTALDYGVPPQLLGIPGDNTYSNYKEARASFWEDTIIPLLQMLAGELNTWIFGTEAVYFLAYNLNSVPAFAEQRAEAWKRAEASTTLTINEKRKIQGFPPIDGGDVLLVAANMLPLLGSDVDEAEDSVLDEETSAEEEEKGRAELSALGISENEIEYYLGLEEAVE